MILITTGIVVALVICSCRLTRVGYETADYLVTGKDSRFEIREYPALDLVSTPMAKSPDSEGGSFMRLFSYISGDNESAQKIPMTTPVFMEESGVDAQMSFVIPQDVAKKGIPDGLKPSIKITKLIKGRYAVYRIKGRRSAMKVGEAKLALREWLRSQNLDSAGPFIMASYDPPFTPSMLQRNEVMVRLK